MKHGKVWGTTFPIFFHNGVALHRIEIKKGGYCSKHSHRHRFNGFLCEKGEVEIHTDRNETELHDITTLKAGELTTVKPGDRHWFSALEDSVVYEWYWVECDPHDIDRDIDGVRSKGGVKNLHRVGPERSPELQCVRTQPEKVGVKASRVYPPYTERPSPFGAVPKNDVA